MRFPVALLITAFIVGSSSLAHADTVSFIVTEDATGSYGSQTFTNAPLTLTLSYSPEQLSQAILFGYYGPNDFSFFQTPNTSTVSIQGIGSFAVDLGVDSIYEGAQVYEDDDNGDLGLPFTLTIPDFQHSVGPVTQTVGYTNPDDSCYPNINTACPPYFATTSGSDPLIENAPIYVTSLGGTWTQEMIVTSSTPEPSSFVLLGTGILGMIGLLRRKSLSI
ncbi:PEP-CTERM sorting domain-containing protein [Granulicella sp. S190]|uniref:PEP-CTERM sorting domain-containing protein n=1 Tax=Granulicella sp. S190 TaxID=1747226 RepID=UPI00131C0210|nr:PEP-CTERM sorting domain-containing protein [Granulicella sp. S190]